MKNCEKCGQPLPQPKFKGGDVIQHPDIGYGLVVAEAVNDVLDKEYSALPHDWVRFIAFQTGRSNSCRATSVTLIQDRESAF